MFSVNDFLDRAKQRAGLDSDYALAKAIGVHRANISSYRTERTAPDGRAIIALCKLSGDDPEHVAACIQSMRAANDEEAELWQRVAKRLARHHVLVMGAVAMLFVAAAPDSAQAATLHHSAIAGGSLYIMSNS